MGGVLPRRHARTGRHGSHALRQFLLYNAAGGIAWGVTVVLAGYAAGASYAKVENALGPVAALVVLGLALIALFAWRIRRRRTQRNLEESRDSSG